MTPKQIRGAAYTFEQFMEKYGLTAEEAQMLFAKFGPSSVDLDILMRAKGRTPETTTVAA
ncbi:hypothetical protein DEM27_15600 [Metarhizobium album]|uniref:DUF3606 domain-containing protein n=1 Tax=Metarhizobium album TaxID=2182425 RepID=A0A2U2DQ75_9HYPH|nr:hypothetical protein [Rhizobium album]PWE55476.1 hypothetical protein DEM27_15600 [Rhizobium album]